MRKKRRLQVVVGVVATAAVGLVGVGMFRLMQSFSGAPPVPQEVVRQVTMLRPPPPPPPPTEKPPEPEVEQESEQVIAEALEAPAPIPDAGDAPPGTDLGLDAAGVAGGDSFGLVGKKGGRSLLGGGEGTVFGWYAGQLRRAVEGELAGHEEIRHKEYVVIVHVWVDGQGRVRRSAVAQSSGDPGLDRAIEVALNGVRGTRELPPADMPQPVKLRIRSRL